jgi:hypothetical protein
MLKTRSRTRVWIRKMENTYLNKYGFKMNNDKQHQRKASKSQLQLKSLFVDRSNISRASMAMKKYQKSKRK